MGNRQKGKYREEDTERRDGGRDRGKIRTLGEMEGDRQRGRTYGKGQRRTCKRGEREGGGEEWERKRKGKGKGRGRHKRRDAGERHRRRHIQEVEKCDREEQIELGEETEWREGGEETEGKRQRCESEGKRHKGRDRGERRRREGVESYRRDLLEMDGKRQSGTQAHGLKFTLAYATDFSALLCPLGRHQIHCTLCWEESS